MTSYAGIDFSTHAIHIVFVDEDDGHVRWKEYELDGHDAFERARAVRDALPGRSWWNAAGIVAIGLEEQNSGNPTMRNAVQKLKVIQGAILSCLPRGVLVNPMNAAHWRKTLGIPGNASKEDVRAWADANGFPELVDERIPQDVADAYCLAKAVEALTVSA